MATYIVKLQLPFVETAEAMGFQKRVAVWEVLDSAYGPTPIYVAA